MMALEGTDLAALAPLLGAAAAEALREEARAAPKPGLVCPESRGAHDDMDYRLLLASAAALEPGFAACAARALSYEGADPALLLPLLRPLGLEAEAAMFRSTGGVNTHKGAVFCLGLLAAAAALILAGRPSAAAGASEGKGALLGDRARLLAARMARGIVASELGPRLGGGPAASGRRVRGRASGSAASGLAGPGGAASAGERLYREAGVLGARGQAEEGYPVLGSAVLPRLRAAEPPGGGRSREARLDEARIDALLASIALLEDSCLLSRGGPEGLGLARRGAARALALGGAGSEAGRAEILRLDGELCARGLSPGGSADMLAAGIFLVGLEGRFGARPGRTREEADGQAPDAD